MPYPKKSRILVKLNLRQEQKNYSTLPKIGGKPDG
jgi:hypothetical protein